MAKQVRLINTQADKWIDRPYGFSLWRLIMNSRFWFVSYFATGNYFMGCVGIALLIAVLGLLIRAGDDADKQGIAVIFAMIYVVVGLFSAGSADRRIGRSLLRKGWVFADPDSEAATKARRSWLA